MLSITSIDGPEVHGPNRYRVLNPAKNGSGQLHDSQQKYFGFSCNNIILNGEEVHVHHVSHRRLPAYPNELIIVVQRKQPRRMQCKDIPDLPILQFLADLEYDRQGQYTWATWHDNSSMPNICEAMPAWARNTKLPLAKLRSLAKRGLIASSSQLTWSRCSLSHNGAHYLNKSKVLIVHSDVETDIRKENECDSIEPIEPVARHELVMTGSLYSAFEVGAPVAREWHAGPDGPNDREIDIWYNGNWVPAYFSDLKKSDFFLDIKIGKLEPERCYQATSDVKRVGSRAMLMERAYDPSFVVQGIEVVQAPSIKDITPLAVETNLPRLENK